MLVVPPRSSQRHLLGKVEERSVSVCDARIHAYLDDDPDRNAIGARARARAVVHEMESPDSSPIALMNTREPRSDPLSLGKSRSAERSHEDRKRGMMRAVKPSQHRLAPVTSDLERERAV